MKEINLLSGNYLLTEVPNDAYDFKFKEMENGHNILDYKIKNKENGYSLSSAFFTHNHNYQIVATTNDITEEQCESIVEDCDIYAKCWKEYTYQNNNEKDVRFNSMYSCRTAKKSLQSLIKSVGLDVKNNYLILKKL